MKTKADPRIKGCSYKTIGLLKVINDHYQSTGIWPTRKELSNIVGWHVNGSIDSLMARGVIEPTYGKKDARLILIEKPKSTTTLKPFEPEKFDAEQGVYVANDQHSAERLLIDGMRWWQYHEAHAIPVPEMLNTIGGEPQPREGQYRNWEIKAYLPEWSVTVELMAFDQMVRDWCETVGFDYVTGRSSMDRHKPEHKEEVHWGSALPKDSEVPKRKGSYNNQYNLGPKEVKPPKKPVSAQSKRRGRPRKQTVFVPSVGDVIEPKSSTRFDGLALRGSFSGETNTMPSEVQASIDEVLDICRQRLGLGAGIEIGQLFKIYELLNKFGTNK